MKVGTGNGTCQIQQVVMNQCPGARGHQQLLVRTKQKKEMKAVDGDTCLYITDEVKQYFGLSSVVKILSSFVNIVNV